VATPPWRINFLSLRLVSDACRWDRWTDLAWENWWLFFLCSRSILTSTRIVQVS